MSQLYSWLLSSRKDFHSLKVQVHDLILIAHADAEAIRAIIMVIFKSYNRQITSCTSPWFGTDNELLPVLTCFEGQNKKNISYQPKLVKVYYVFYN